MADDDAENIFQSSSSRPFTVRGGFPFVFLPSAFTEGFTFVDHPGDASSTDEQETTEPEQKKPDEAAPNKEQEEEEEEEEDDDERDRSEKNDDGIDRSNDVRISQPKYSQLLRDLDFGKARMVDVTEILSKDLESSANNTSPDDNEQENKTTTDESTTSTVEDQPTDQAKPEDEEQLRNAADEIQNDLNNLAAIIQAAAQISTVDDEKHPPSPMVKKPTFDEDDDTSKQATQNYDLHDYEQERGKAVVTERSTIEKEEQEDVSPTTAVTWDQLVYGEATKKDPVSSENVVQADELKAKDQVDGGASAPATEEFPRGFRRISDSPSSNTESVVERENDLGSNDRRASSSSSQIPAGPTEDEAKESSVRRMPAGTERQDSQGTLIDENLDDLTSQLKQVLFDQERQTLNTSTKEERTTDGIGSMSFPLSTPDKLSTDLADENARRRKFADLRSDDPTKEFLHRTTTGTNDHPQRLNSSKKRTHHRHHHHRSVERDHPSNLRQSDDNWLNMLEKLEREHRLRLEQQQHQYEHYMHDLEEKMQRRFDEYLTLTSGFQESRLHNYEEMSPLHRTHTSMPIDTNIGRYKTHSTRPSERPVVKDIISHYYPADSTLNILSSNKRRSTSSSTAFPRSQSKDDLVHARAELSARHAKHLADLKSYEDEINEIRDQINRTKMGHGSSVTRQSMETIERINNDNVRLHDEINDLRHNLKITQDENLLLKRQLEDLRDQITNKDFELKNYHRTIADLEQQITQAENTKERQDEKFRHADRQSLLYREENEKLKIDLNLTRDRLVRLEERYRELEAENETLRRQVFKADHEHRPTSRVIDDMKFNSNLPSARDYGRFHLSTSRHSSSTLNASRDTHLETPRYTTNGSDTLYRQDRSPRPMTRISDYLNDPPAFPPPYIPPTKAVYSPRKTSPNRRRYGSSNLRSSLERPAKPSEQLEQKFDQLLKRKRDLEARMSRIPTRHLTSADRQLYDVLEREIARVEQQIASVKLELRKLNVFPVHKI